MEAISLEHEILSILYSISENTVDQGTSEIPVHVKDYSKCYLQFGILFDKINKSYDFTKECMYLEGEQNIKDAGPINGVKKNQELSEKIGKIATSKLNQTFSRAEISNAVDVLKMDKNVTDTLKEFKGKHPLFEPIKQQFITLTEAGAYAYVTKHYLNKIKKEELEEKQIDSIIRTNASVRDTNNLQKDISKGSFLLAFISAIFIGITVYQECNDKTEERLEDINKSIQHTKNSLDSIVLFQRQTDSSIRQIADSIAKSAK